MLVSRASKILFYLLRLLVLNIVLISRPMELANSSFPIRAFIRHKAKVRIINPFYLAGACAQFDEKLLKELAATLFKSNKWRDSFRPYPSREAADEVEDELAADLAETYLRIKQNQANPAIQHLNTLFLKEA